MATDTPPAAGPAPAERPPDPDAPTQVQPAAGEPGAPQAQAASEPPPRLADGIELVGEYRDSGFKEPPYIVRRSDGQVIQLPPLLYRLAEHVDGRRGYDEIGEALSHAVGRGVTGDMVKMLADEQLRPLGVLASADGSSPELQKADPLLGLKFRTAVIPEGVTRALTTIFKPLFLPPVVVAVVVGLFALDAWLLFDHGISGSLRAVIYNPALLLGLLACVALATAFHEIGHATGCRYGGAKPGVMGVGIYVVWPAFYTDVTDAYRLSRGGRLRTDLGGVFFNAVFALVSAGVYFATRFEPLLLLVLLQNFAILQQLLPLLRLDGYYIISDLTGVPDMLSRIKPVLSSMIPGRKPSDRVTELKPWVRVVVTAYVCTVVPVLLASLVLMVLHAPRAFATAYDSVGVQWDRIASASGLIAGAAGAVQLATLVLPCAGMVLTSGRIGGRVCGSAWRWSDGEPLRRGVLGIGTITIAALAAFIWWPNGDYRPIQPTERGTVQGAVRSLSAVPTGRPALTRQRERELGGAPSERQRRRAQQPATEPKAPDEKRQRSPSGQTTSTATTETTTTPTDTTTTPTDTVPTTPTDTVPTTPTDTVPTTPVTTAPVPPTDTATTPGAAAAPVPPTDTTTTTTPAPAPAPVTP
jgi:putative peptide zinc metalloprotease protein